MMSNEVLESRVRCHEIHLQGARMRCISFLNTYRLISTPQQMKDEHFMILFCWFFIDALCVFFESENHKKSILFE